MIKPLIVAVLLLGWLSACGQPAEQDPPELSPATVSGGDSVAMPPVPTADGTRPTLIRVPAIHAASSLTTVGVDAHNVIQVPPEDTPQQAAWYRLGPVPGALGPAVIVGHINGNHKQGVFAHLADLKVGDTVEVTRSDNKIVTFTVVDTQLVGKTAFPTAAVYGDTSNAALRLLSCGGRLDKVHHRYLDQVIAYADLTSVRDSR